MPLLWLSLAFLTGVLLGALLEWPLTIWALLAAALAAGWLALFLLRRAFRPGFSFPFSSYLSQSPLSVSLLLLVVLGGAARYQASQPALSPDSVAWYTGQKSSFVVEGVLVAPPDERDTYTNLRLQVEQLHPQGELLFTPVHGLLLARLPSGGNWRYGDRLRLQGQLQSPPEDETFSYRDYLARQGIYAYMSQARANLLQHGQGNPFLDLVYRVKSHSMETIYRLFPDPEASLLSGILLGVETGIPERVQAAFQATGTSHVIAISGFNMTILAALYATTIGRLLGKRRRFLGAGISAGLIAVYTVLVGAEAAVLRAALMGGLSLFARQLGRRQDGLNSLVFVGALMALGRPTVLWDVGFQLSFMATLGLILYADPLSQAFIRFAGRFLPAPSVNRLAGPVGEYFLFTLAAQLATLPVTIYHFQRLSLVSLLANPVILPVQTAVMILGGLALLLGLAWLPLGQLAAALAWPCVAFTIRAVEFFAHWPSANLALGRVALPLVLGFYLLLLGWTFFRPRLPALAGLLRPSLALFGMGILTVTVWRMAWSAPDGRLHLFILDVGSGDGLLVQAPSGRYLLIDGGPSPSKLSDALGRRLPLFGRELDFLVVAATEGEQLAGLPRNLDRFPPQAVLWSGPPAGTRAARDLQVALGQRSIPWYQAETGQALDLGQGARLQLLAVGKRGAVLLLEWNRFRALLPIGQDFDLLEQQKTLQGPLSALLLADSGYAPSNPPDWIAALQPQVVLLSVGLGDRSGLPDPETLQAVQGYTLLRTDQNGWIHLSTDGEQMWVEVEKP